MEYKLLLELLRGCCDDIICYDTIGSTNTALKEIALSGAPTPMLVTADKQTAGKGSRGRSFYSPAAGAYFSVLIPAENLSIVTPTAAVATAEAVDSMFDVHCGIKWPNDVLLVDKKISGILAETSGGFTVLGIGINVARDAFPDLANAGYITEHAGAGVREALVASVVKLFLKYRYEHDYVLDRFKARSILIGREVIVSVNGADTVTYIDDIDDEFRLVARGFDKPLVSGEVSIYRS